MLLPHFDSGLCFDMPSPGGPLFDGGVSGGVAWDGTFYRDLTRYAASGPLFWSAYLKPGTAPGENGGYWLNFGSGWCHLQNDDPAQMLGGAAPRVYYEPVAAVSDRRNDNDSRRSETAATVGGQWKLIIEATMFVTLETVLVWSGVKAGGNDPCGVYTRVDGLDTTGTLTVEAAS